MLKGLAIGIDHFPDFQPYVPKIQRIGILIFNRGLNVIICSALEQGMSDEDYDLYCRDFSPLVKGTSGNVSRFEELVFG